MSITISGSHRTTQLSLHGSLITAVHSTELDHGLSEPQIKCIAQQLFVALQFVHECGCIHRDLKAGNILLCPDGTIRLGRSPTHRHLFISTECVCVCACPEKEITGYCPNIWGQMTTRLWICSDNIWYMVYWWPGSIPLTDRLFRHINSYFDICMCVYVCVGVGVGMCNGVD